MICPKCGTNNGITCYSGKECKKCGFELIKSVKIPDVKMVDGVIQELDA
jgi:DNA-directed RNA polymerase subunit RPC12/RpoP